MPLNVRCKNCNNYRNGWCERVIDSPDPDMQRDCRHFWERTNADRIRAMGDDELADGLLAVSFGMKPWCDFHCENQCDDGCDNCIKAWLQQPVKEEST